MTNQMAVQLLGNSLFLLKQEHQKLKQSAKKHQHVMVRQAITDEILEVEERIGATAKMLEEMTVEGLKEIEATQETFLEAEERINKELEKETSDDEGGVAESSEPAES